MSIRLLCPGCRKQLAVPDATAGQMGRCPDCSTLFHVPARSAPPRRTAVAMPLAPPPEPAPPGLRFGQKLGFVVVALLLLAGGGVFAVHTLLADRGERDELAAVAPSNVENGSTAPRTQDQSTSPTPTRPPTPQPNNDDATTDALEEDTGQQPRPMRETSYPRIELPKASLPSLAPVPPPPTSVTVAAPPDESRYNAACAAALAGCGQGKDADQTDDKERLRLRRQALDWLRADLAAWKQVLDKDPKKAPAHVHETMRHWQQDTDFVGVRGDAALAKLPESERQEWQKLWEEVEALRNRAAK